MTLIGVLRIFGRLDINESQSNYIVIAYQSETLIPSTSRDNSALMFCNNRRHSLLVRLVIVQHAKI